VVRATRLGSTATYRVREVHDGLVAVEVVKGPGLEPGQRFEFTADAVARMEPVATHASLRALGVRAWRWLSRA
jgi:hypothetical protein